LAVDLANLIWKVNLCLKARQPFLLLKFLPASFGLTGVFLDAGISAWEEPPQEPALLPSHPLSFELYGLLDGNLELRQEAKAFLLSLGEKFVELC
jgi:hypothetical protein